MFRDDQSLACSFCQLQDETSDHLFCTCAFSMAIWRMVLGWFGVSIALPSLVKALFVQFPVFGRCSSKREALVTVWMATCWSLWLMRNRVIFDNGELDTGLVLDLIQVRSWHWIKAKRVNFQNSFYEWKLSPLACLDSL
uniref:Reverse transcriptase zinc-binding domain-containing protein n=1 Tax=Lotus japonicus TaxID=34305 RepID=I3SCE4_LOTJA|nr:unknown [Lotus japonicus]